MNVVVYTNEVECIIPAMGAIKLVIMPKLHVTMKVTRPNSKRAVGGYQVDVYIGYTLSVLRGEGGGGYCVRYFYTSLYVIALLAYHKC